jgi:hypothetical protein
MVFSAIVGDEAIQIGLFQRVQNTNPSIVGPKETRRFSALLAICKLNLLEVTWYKLT